ncbi:CopD family protein [Halomonas sp. LR3S48]|uniref:CopD family protein n=1 Tax=Halomonas sp. LR3S48 TaxID=2982694 RepID=UPI0021E4BE65|nr:CopD family protein [Halomonas sp. LR3S48]UYG04784.1 CopD family protein [Halomonas sp. LR3S48]
MPWIKILHIATLLCWCASLLYLPAMLLAGARSRGASSFDLPVPIILRFVFTHIATPFALLAIMSGTLLFIVGQIAMGWLVLKLAAVSGMVLCHVLCGGLIVRLERDRHRFLLPASGLIAVTSAVLMLTVLVLVLSKPFV